jgi:hypothetical protein
VEVFFSWLHQNGLTPYTIPLSTTTSSKMTTCEPIMAPDEPLPTMSMRTEYDTGRTDDFSCLMSTSGLFRQAL